MTAPKPAARALLNHSQLSPWHQDNEHIRHGYRTETASTRSCFASWAYLHNETANIVSHLLPAVAFIFCPALLFPHFRTYFPEATATERWIGAFFFFAAAACFGISAVYHTLMNHSAYVSSLWLRLDYVGIVILTLGDFVSGIYVVFYCEPELRKVHWTMVSSLGIATATVLVNPSLQHSRYRSSRIGIFVCNGLAGFAPLVHGISIYGIEQMNVQSGMPYYLLEGSLLALGVAFYATRVPESIRPGRFDTWGCSHQIFHVLVVLATVVHGWGIWSAFDYNYHNRICAA